MMLQLSGLLPDYSVIVCPHIMTLHIATQQEKCVWARLYSPCYKEESKDLGHYPYQKVQRNIIHIC